MKQRARQMILTTRPNPCLVTLALLVFGWLVNYIMQKIGGLPFVIDLDAVSALDYQNIFRVDFAHAEFFPTALLAVYQILSIILSFGYISYLLRVARQETSGFGNLLDGFAVAWRALVLTVFINVLVSVASILLVIPGIIVSYMYSMATFLQMDHPDWSPMRCMQESRLMMRGHKWELFVLQLSFLGWQLLSMIPGAVVFVKPYVSLTETVFYEKLRGADAPSLPEESDDQG